MTKEIDDTTVAVWTSLMRSGKRSLDHIEAALAGNGLPPLGWDDALLEIERAGPEGLRPFELQNRLLLPQYGMSRLLNRIEKAGFIRKVSCPADGRGHVVQITPQGQAIRKQIWPIYAQCLKEIWADQFSSAELSALKSLLDRVAPPEGSTEP